MHLPTLARALASAAAAPTAGGNVAGIKVDQLILYFALIVIPVAGLIIGAGIVFGARKAKASDNAITLTNVVMGLIVTAMCVGGSMWFIAQQIAGGVAAAK